MRTLTLSTGDSVLVRRVILHVLDQQTAGILPRIAWHDALLPSERQDIGSRWAEAAAAWEMRTPSNNVDTPGDDLLLPLRDLLLAHRVSTDPILKVLANALASGCFGSHHLWQDLGVTRREEVSRLLEFGFPGLHASNLRHLRWKRHLFLVLGERLGRADLRPPKCDRCDEFETCFGPLPDAAGLRTWPLTRIG